MEIKTMVSEDSKPKSESTEISNTMSKVVITVLLVVVWGVAICMCCYCKELVDKFIIPESKTLIKTPFIFAGIVFVSTLVFTDSLMKTIKYNYRNQESLIGNIVQALSLAALAVWFAFKDKIGG